MKGLIADIGGTHIRFALVPAEGGFCRAERLRCADFAGPVEAAAHYLTTQGVACPPRGAFAVACPVLDDDIALINSPWRFSVTETTSRLGMVHLDAVNDFAAVAQSVPLLSPSDMIRIGRGDPDPQAPIAVMGPGTGLGVSALIPHKGDWVVLPAEGGHATQAARTDREAELLAWLRARNGHVSIERVVSGPGLSALHAALCQLAGKELPAPLSPEVIGQTGTEGGDSLAARALSLFFAFLGISAGNIALTLGARGGVVLAGGILPQMAEALQNSDFRTRFEDKGRFHDYMARIPVSLVTHPFPALLGLSGLIQRAV